MCLMHAETGFTRQPTDRRGVLKIYVVFLFCSGRLALLLDQLSADTFVFGGGLVIVFFGFRGCLLGRGAADGSWA